MLYYYLHSMKENKRSITFYDLQRKISQIVIETGQILLKYGAESAVVVNTTQRMGKALGAEEIEISLSSSSMVISTIMNNHCMTITKRCPSRGINMNVIAKVQQLCITTEKKQIGVDELHQYLSEIQVPTYNRYLVILMIGLSCGAFSKIAGGDWVIFGITFLASAVGMFVRQELTHRSFNVLLIFGITGFITTLISALAMLLHLGNEPFIAVASAVLFLAPGYPLINSVSDMLKGFINMGLARWTTAVLLVLVTVVGMLGAMHILKVW